MTAAIGKSQFLKEDFDYILLFLRFAMAFNSVNRTIRKGPSQFNPLEGVFHFLLRQHCRFFC